MAVGKKVKEAAAAIGAAILTMSIPGQISRIQSIVYTILYFLILYYILEKVEK